MFLATLLAVGATLTTRILALPAAGNACVFTATTTQMCNHNNVFTSLAMPHIYVGESGAAIAPNGGKRTSLSKPWHVRGLREDFVAEFKDGNVVYAYGNESWDGREGVGFTCDVGTWSEGELDCASPGSRTQNMSCSFTCTAAPTHMLPISPLPAPNNPSPDSSMHIDPIPRSDPALPFLAPSSPIPSTLLTASHTPGLCSFHLQLMQLCLHNPTEHWHTEVLGNIFSIQDGSRATAVTYPEGAGRIDERAKKLVNFGKEGLTLAFWHDGKTYFRFDGRSWDTGSRREGDGWVGVCEQGKWSRERFECGAKSGGERRVSEMACVFKC